MCVWSDCRLVQSDLQLPDGLTARSPWKTQDAACAHASNPMLLYRDVASLQTSNAVSMWLKSPASTSAANNPQPRVCKPRPKSPSHFQSCMSAGGSGVITSTVWRRPRVKWCQVLQKSSISIAFWQEAALSAVLDFEGCRAFLDHQSGWKREEWGVGDAIVGAEDASLGLKEPGALAL